MPRPHARVGGPASSSLVSHLRIGIGKDGWMADGDETTFLPFTLSSRFLFIFAPKKKVYLFFSPA